MKKRDDYSEFKVPGDDAKQTKKWSAFMTECAYYFDYPNLEQESTMRDTLQRDYDDLLPDGWRPPLQSRRDLMEWACTRYNEGFNPEE